MLLENTDMMKIKESAGRPGSPWRHRSLTRALSCLAAIAVTAAVGSNQAEASSSMWTYTDNSYDQWAYTQHPTLGYSNNYYLQWNTSYAPSYPYYDYGWTNYYNYALYGLSYYGAYVPLQPSVDNGGNPPGVVSSNHGYWPWSTPFDSYYWQQIYWNQ